MTSDPAGRRRPARRGGAVHRCLTCPQHQAVVYLPLIGGGRVRLDATPRATARVAAERAYVVVTPPGRTTAHAVPLADLPAGSPAPARVLQLHVCPREGRC